MNERMLADSVTGHQLWAEATDELFREDWEVGDQAEYYGEAFIGAFIEKELSRNQLKSMVKEANQLERDAVEKSGGDIERLGDADYIEAMGRRIAHHTLKYALEVVHYNYRGY